MICQGTSDVRNCSKSSEMVGKWALTEIVVNSRKMSENIGKRRKISELIFGKVLKDLVCKYGKMYIDVKSQKLAQEMRKSENVS